MRGWSWTHTSPPHAPAAKASLAEPTSRAREIDHATANREKPTRHVTVNHAELTYHGMAIDRAMEIRERPMCHGMATDRATANVVLRATPSGAMRCRAAGSFGWPAVTSS